MVLKQLFHRIRVNKYFYLALKYLLIFTWSSEGFDSESELSNWCEIQYGFLVIDPKYVKSTLNSSIDMIEQNENEVDLRLCMKESGKVSETSWFREKKVLMSFQTYRFQKSVWPIETQVEANRILALRQTCEMQQGIQSDSRRSSTSAKNFFESVRQQGSVLATLTTTDRCLLQPD